jgi:hypothetical protein
VEDERDREKVLAWIRSLPLPERARVVRTMGEARVRQAIAAEGDRAIYELTRNATWAEVARELGMTTRMVNRAVTRHRAAQQKESTSE